MSMNMNQLARAVAAAVAPPTTTPWVIIVETERTVRRADGPGQVVEAAIHIIEKPVGERPDPFDHVPEGATVNRAEAFHPTRFAALRQSARFRYLAAFTRYLQWRVARELGVPVDDVFHSQDVLDEHARQVARWLEGGEGCVETRP